MKNTRNIRLREAMKTQDAGKPLLLFSDNEMERLLMKIQNPEQKISSLFNKYNFRYKKLFYTLQQASDLLQITLKQQKAAARQSK